MSKEKPGVVAKTELAVKIKKAARERIKELALPSRGIIELPAEIGELSDLTSLYLTDNLLKTLPETIGQLTKLKLLVLDRNRMIALPESIGLLSELKMLDLGLNKLEKLPESFSQLVNLEMLDLKANKFKIIPDSLLALIHLNVLVLDGMELATLPESIGQLTGLQNLYLGNNQLESLPESIGQLTGLQNLYLGNNQLESLPESIGQLTGLQNLYLGNNQLESLPESIGQLSELQSLDLEGNQLESLPESIGQLTGLQNLYLGNNQLESLPESIGQLSELQSLDLEGNQLRMLPISLGQMEKMIRLSLNNNPLSSGLQSAYEKGFEELLAYLYSLKDSEFVEKLYEAKLLFVGEGGVGKTTLLKAMTQQEPRQDEPTTHGIEIDVQSLRIVHPEEKNINIRFNAWDFGGQEVYRVTHQFFFSRRSIFLLVWEPRMGVKQCQVEEWLKLIRLRVGDNARVIIISTHSKTGERIARIDKPVLMRDFGSIIFGFHEVDSLVDDPETLDKVGVAELKVKIAEVAKELEQMGMPFNRNWRNARDRLLEVSLPHITYQKFEATCKLYGLDSISAKTLAELMHDLGYIVYYPEDNRLSEAVVLQPEWLTKAIGYVLEDRITQKMDGILPDTRLKEVWWNHPFKDQPRYEPLLYPFFLRLMEKFDVTYRLEEGTASLVAQHVPQVRPELPWLPEHETTMGLRRVAMVCIMEESPPGLVPWMIVRTHEYSFVKAYEDGRINRFHWQKGICLKNRTHGEAILELRDREFHVYVQAVWPEFFMNVLKMTLSSLITDKWPGMKGRYYFAVPCKSEQEGRACDGRFDIGALRQFLDEGDATIRCQVCRTRQSIVELVYGFEEEDSREQLLRIETKLDYGFSILQKEIGGLESRLANYVMTILQAIASESKVGPRLFSIEPLGGNWIKPHVSSYKLHFWCEAEECQHPVLEKNKGVYEIEVPRNWIKKLSPYANFIAGVLRTILPMVAPSVNALFGPNTIEQLGLKDHLDLMKEATGKMLTGELEISGSAGLRQGLLTEREQGGILALHAILREKDRYYEHLGLQRVPTYKGDYLWLCKTHYEESQPKIPERIEN